MAKTLNDLEIGSIVNLEENGELVPFIVLQHQYYEDVGLSQNCTTILRKNVLSEKIQWGTYSNINYPGSNVDDYLNGTYLSKIDEKVREYIISTNIRYTTVGGYGSTSRKIFSLSSKEYNLGIDATDDGVIIPYFDSNKKRIAKENDSGNAVIYSTRSGKKLAYAMNLTVTETGRYGLEDVKIKQYIRPAMNFPNDMLVTDETPPKITVNQPPTVPGNLTVGAISKGQPVDISWTASTDPDGTVASYTLQRQVDGTPFTTINSGNVLTYQDTVGNEWGTVAYRVAAVDNLGASSDWATSQTYTVQDGLLYIEGPEDELGTQNKAFTFAFAVKATGASQPASVAIVAQVDGTTVLNEPAANVGQQYSFTVDARPMQAGAHTISVAATADHFVSYRDTYNFNVDAFPFPSGGLKVINQDYLGRPHFYPTMANMVLMPDGKNLAEKIEELMGGAG